MGAFSSAHSYIYQLLTKYHNRKKSNRRRLPKDYNFPFSEMKDATQKEFKSFSIRAGVNLFGLNNLEFNVQVSVLKSPLEPSGCQDVPLHSPSLQQSWHFKNKMDNVFGIQNNSCTFILFCYLYMKILFLGALTIYPSLFLFRIFRLWEIFCLNYFAHI